MDRIGSPWHFAKISLLREETGLIWTASTTTHSCAKPDFLLFAGEAVTVLPDPVPCGQSLDAADPRNNFVLDVECPNLGQGHLG